ncbi:MAG: hypothetical protein ACKN9D_04530, partial [Actinomycetales bacterium]
DQVPAGVITPTAELAEPLRDLVKATGVTLEGSEILDGQELRRYAMQLPTDARGFGFTDTERAGLTPPLSVTALVWVDDQGRINRVLRTLSTPVGAVATTDARLSAFSDPVTIRSPLDPS